MKIRAVTDGFSFLIPSTEGWPNGSLLLKYEVFSMIKILDRKAEF